MKNLPTFEFSNMDFSRIAVIGCPGSGKTTFTKSLGEIFLRPVSHLDKVLWEKNWQMLPYEKRVEIHSGLISAEQWIIDGMWKSHLADRFPRATLVIFLDFKRGVCVRRAIRRRIKFSGKQRDDIADGCLEKLDAYFMKYIWTFKKKVRPLILQLEKDFPEVQVVTLKTPKEASIFISQLQNFALNPPNSNNL